MDDILSRISVLSLFNLIFCVIYVIFAQSVQSEEVLENQRYKIEGKVAIPSTAGQDWISTTRILVDGGEYLGFPKQDGTFTINGVPTGSYVIEVANSNYMFEPFRVDINSKGKIRARRVNNVQTSIVNHAPYPLRFKTRGKANYFMKREQWRITDFLMNPMVLMMVLPLIFIAVIPKLVNTNDPETQKDLQNQMNMFKPNNQMPDVSEIFTNLFGGGSSGQKKTAKPKPKKRQS